MLLSVPRHSSARTGRSPPWTTWLTPSLRRDLLGDGGRSCTPITDAYPPRPPDRGDRQEVAMPGRLGRRRPLRGTRPPKAGSPWTEREDALVRILPAKEVAKRTGRTLVAVWGRRQALELPDGRTR